MKSTIDQATHPGEDSTLDGYHEHEALDRLHIVCSMIDEHLLAHPYITARPDLLRLVKAASESLADAYCQVDPEGWE